MADRVTDEELDRLEELLSKATPGPWECGMVEDETGKFGSGSRLYGWSEGGGS